MDQIAAASGSYYSNNNNYINANNNNCQESLDEVNDAQQQQHHNHQFNFVKRVVPLTSSASPSTAKNMARHRSSISEPKNFMSSLSSNPSSNLNSLDFWDYTIELECLQGPKDLQLAAELGKTLLERNRELENELKQHQTTIDDQAQEIEYLQKSKTALEEVNQARLNFYEKLEDGISKMERDHQQLIIENNNEKKNNKTMKRTIEQLECKIEELHKNLAETQKNLIAEKRKNERLEKEKNSDESCALKFDLRKLEFSTDESLNEEVDGFIPNKSANDSCSFAFTSPRNPEANSTGLSLNGTYIDASSEQDEEILRVVGDLEKALQCEKERVNELEDQLGEIIVENKALQGRIAQTSTNENYKSVHDELSSLDEVRQGQLCCRCLRQVHDQYGYDETLSIAPTEDDDDLVDSASIINANRNEHIAAQTSIKESRKSPPNTLPIEGEQGHSQNPYRDLVDKYEALLEIQRQSNPRHRGSVMMVANSLADEMKAAKANEQIEKQEKEDRICARDAMSEAETSSSGYSDETSTKATQTDAAPGYFLCSIGNSDIDGEDCKFSIYDDSSQSIDSRFRNRPEYRELFKEIFAVLKKAADNKAEGEKLPLLDDEQHEIETKGVLPVPPVTPAAENIPEPSEIDCDSQSIISSAVSEQSFAMSECITKLERKSAKKQHAAVVAAQSTQKLYDPSGKVLIPLKREPLDYLSAGLGPKRRNRNRKNRSEGRSDSPSGNVVTSPRSGRKRRDYRPFDFQLTPSPLATPPNQQSPSAKQEWDGSSLIIYNKRNYNQAADSTPRTSRNGEVDMNSSEYHRSSTLFQDFHKLKKLDMSYAEVLRKASAFDNHHHYYHYQCQMQNSAGCSEVGNSQGHKKTHRSNNFYHQQRQHKHHQHQHQNQPNSHN